MTTEMILNSIAKWQAVIKHSAALVSYFDQGNHFVYDNKKYDDPSDFIHCYPGIYKDKLMFFLIPAAYDKEEYKDKLHTYTQACPVSWTVAGPHRISNLKAKERMDRWKNEYKEWVPKQADSAIGMFKAFNIPADDFESEDGCIATLGLQLHGDEGGMTADIIVANATAAAMVKFDDFVKPVPPFGKTASEESFYLLKAVLI